jgi:uncharacterized protein (DUF4415 family)
MSEIKYGKKDLISQEDLDPKNAKERLSIWIDESIVDAFRERAKAENTKYQTLMNQALREFIEKPSLAQRVERIEKQLKLA